MSGIQGCLSEEEMAMAQAEADMEYINEYVMGHVEEVAMLMDNYPKDGNYMKRVDALRMKILEIRDTEKNG